jgi:hypothetical protein
MMDDFPPEAYSIADVCRITRSGRTAVYKEIKSGRLRARKRGRRTIVLPGDLRQFLESLPAVATNHHEINDPGRVHRPAPLPHPDPRQDHTPSPTTCRAQARPGERAARSARKGAKAGAPPGGGAS